MHRDFLFAEDMQVHRIQQADLDEVYDLICGLDEEDDMKQ